MSKPLVCLIDSALSPPIGSLELERGVLGEAADIQPALVDDPRQDRELLRSAAAFIVFSPLPKISRALMEDSGRLRVVVRAGVGYDNVDTEAAASLGIPVCNVPDYGTEEVADHALMLTLALERRLKACAGSAASGQWSWQAALPTHRIRGQCFGVVGCGRIGSAAALRAKAFGFRVVFYDPYLASGYEKALGVERAGSLAELLAAADVVTLHAPLTAETRGMIGEPELARMKPGALLVNTARGPLVQERALAAALGRGALGGAALDVVENEPAFAPELLAHSNCLLTPHAAFYSVESVVDMRSGAASIVRRVLEGGAPVNVVNGVAAARAAAS